MDATASSDVLSGLADMREPYSDRGLEREELAAEPLTQFARWLADAAALPEPNAMVLATAGTDGMPATRTVLLKAADSRGFVFFTNRGSRKGRHLAANPVAALTFPWFAQSRQVGVVGQVVEVSREESAAYFATRPRASRLGAWASAQSEVIEGREVLDEAYASAEQRFPDEVPVPDFWGGYVVIPESVEFWAGRLSRLHDRWRYRRVADGGLDDATAWTAERLSP